jgi:hypothetical protein
VWTVLIGVAILQSSPFEEWLAWAGSRSTSFRRRLARVRRPLRGEGWTVAGATVPIAYTAWSIWLIGAGLGLLFG